MLHEIQQIRGGFTLAEVTMVVAFIALLAVVAIPGLLPAHGRLQAAVLSGLSGAPRFFAGAAARCISIAGNQASMPTIRRDFPADRRHTAGVVASSGACGSPSRSPMGHHTTEPAI